MNGNRLAALLMLLWFHPLMVKGEILAELDGIMKPTALHVAGEVFVIPEAESVSIYSLKNFMLIEKFGKRGEGPGEFRAAPEVLLVPGRILTHSAGQCQWFNLKGELIRSEKRLDFQQPIPLGDHYLAFFNDFNPPKKQSLRKFVLVDKNFKKVKEIYIADFDVNMMMPGETKPPKFKMIRHYLGHAAAGGKFFIADSGRGFSIEVYDSGGRHLDSIRHVEKRVKVSDAYKKKVMAAFTVSHRHIVERFGIDRFSFYEYFPAINACRFTAERIYVTTYREKNGLHEVIILDHEGKIRNRIFLPLKSMRIYKNVGEVDPYCFHDGKLYELIENSEEVWELHCTDIP